MPPDEKATAKSVAHHIETLVREGALRPQDLLLSERDLAERLSVSRPTIREAISMLTRRGLLVSGPGARTIVANTGTSITDPLLSLLASGGETTFDYIKFREICDGAAASLAATHGTTIDFENISKALDRIEFEHTKCDTADEAEADLEFHMAIYEAAHNVVLLHVIRALIGMLRSGMFYSRSKLYERAEIREAFLKQHRAIHAAITGRDAKAAAAAATMHLQFVDNALREVLAADKRLGVALRRAGTDGGNLSSSRKRKR